MKKINLSLIAIFVFIFTANAQNSEKEKAENYLAKQGELTFTFQIERDSDLERLTHNMSLVNYNPITKTVKAWANEAQFRMFESTNLPFQVPKNENEVDESAIYDVRPLAARSAASTLTFPLSTYPTYAEYAQQMQDFEDDYPALVEKVSIGFTGQGDKELLFVKISDNVSTDEQEPKIMFTSSMHGDEIAGYPMMLTLIDYILTVYSNTSHADHNRVKNLVENAEIWINPNANPDGTYHNSPTNTSVVNARRGNGNNVDLNRNYPDNIAGPHDDGNAYQTETIAFMNFADAHNFVIAANFHGGTELVNYPFDNAYPSQHEHADTEWYEYVGVEYATHCQNDANAGNTSTPTYLNKPTYMTDDDDWDGSPSYYMQSPGVTHGAEWYRVYGGRQDYMNFYQHCREVTIELSDQKILQESRLDDYWYYNRDALLDYLTQGTYGFRGVVLDANTNNPIEGAKVTVVGHDAFGSEVYTDTHGDYYRPIKAGTYSLLFEAPCYQSFTLNSQSITDGTTNILSDILLTPQATVPTGLGTTNVSTTSATLNWNAISGMTYDLRYRAVGAPSWTTTSVSTATFQLTGLTALTQYEFQVRSNCGSFNSAYSSSELFTTTDVVACTGTVISSFPYLETFDSGIGDWAQASGDDGDWILDAGGTPSNNTGPSDDVTGNGNYLFLEASSNNSPGEIGANATAILESPCFNLTGLTEAYFTFSYHSFGTNTGTIEAEISNDDGANWTSVFSNTGNLGDVWNSESIDLMSYLNETVKIRITGTTGSDWSSDIAIDHIGIGGPPPVTYCNSFGDTQYETGVTRVVFGTIDNADGPTKDVGYEDFTNISTDVTQGSTVNLTVRVNTDGNYVAHAFAWIDWNMDGDFDDSGEDYDLGDITNVSNGALPILPITIPESMNFGATRMRVSARYENNPTSCLTNFDGEVEDYTVNVKYDGLLFSGGSWSPSAPDGTTSVDNVLVLDGTYNPNIDISINNLTINTGATVNIDKANNLLVAGDITTNGDLILNSDSNEFSSLIVDGSVTGMVSYQRHVNIQSGGNDLISAPVTGQTFGTFASANSNIFSNPSNPSQKLFGPWSKVTNEYVIYDTDVTEDANATLDPAVGYRAASTNNNTFAFTGIVNTNTVSINLLHSGPHETEWNLVGNPYPSYINVQSFLNHEVSTGVSNLSLFNSGTAAIYGYDGSTLNGWTIYNLANTTSSTVIAPGQGFFVSADPTKVAAYDLQFTPTMQSTGTSDDFIAGRNAELIYLKLGLSNANNTTRTDFYFNSNASQGFDQGYDAMVWGRNAANFALYSQLVQDSANEALALQTLNYTDINNVSIPLGVNANQGEQLTFSITDMNIPESVNVYLEDVVTNTITLLNETDYVITPSTNLSGTGRFYLRMSDEALSISESNLEMLQVYSNIKEKQIVIKGQLNEETTLVLYDVQGRVIVNTLLDTNALTQTIDASNFSKGVYLTQLINTSGTISKKLIIK